MQNKAIAKLIKEFKKLNISEREKFIDFVSANSSPSDFKFIVDTKLADGIVCPHCGAKGKGVRKSGYQKNGRPRFYCSHCNKKFSVTTNGVLYYSKRTFPYGKCLSPAFFMASLFVRVRKFAE